jgi:hypothetical protein
MVGPGDVSGFNRTNDLLKGEGQIGPLIFNTDLVRRPHRRRQSAASLPALRGSGSDVRGSGSDGDLLNRDGMPTPFIPITDQMSRHESAVVVRSFLVSRATPKAAPASKRTSDS